MLRRFRALALAPALALTTGIGTPLAAEVTLHASFGVAENIFFTARDPQVALDRGGTVIGLSVLHGRGTAVIPWDTVKHLVFIPGDPPMALFTYRDGSERTFEIERCHLLVGGTQIDIHDIAEIDVR